MRRVIVGLAALTVLAAGCGYGRTDATGGGATDTVPKASLSFTCETGWVSGMPPIYSSGSGPAPELISEDGHTSHLKFAWKITFANTGGDVVYVQTIATAFLDQHGAQLDSAQSTVDKYISPSQSLALQFTSGLKSEGPWWYEDSRAGQAKTCNVVAWGPQ
jgi:hypothetical protein